MKLHLRPVIAVTIFFLATSPFSFSQSAAVLEEVIVTAEKRSVRLQDVSQAVTALTSVEVEELQVASFVDLSAIAPGVNVARNEGFKTVITIRGIGNEANQNTIANPSVSYHLDGVYIASPFALQTDFLDLEQIEVLRGPQGTLFGQNSTGGAINVVTLNPDFEEFSGSVDLSLGQYKSLRARASMNIPLSNTLAARVSMLRNNHQGFTQNIANGQDLDDADSLSARVKLLWQPSDNVRLMLGAQRFDERVNGQAQKGIYDPTPGTRRLAQNSRSAYELTSEMYSATVDWELPAFTLKSITSYQSDDIMVQRDNDRHDPSTLPPRFLLQSYIDPEINDQTTTTQEFNLISSAPAFGKLDWVMGVFYLDTEVDIAVTERLDFGFNGIFDPFTEQDIINFRPVDAGFISNSKPERESMSVYAQGSWALTDKTRLIGGLRYTSDEVYSEVTNFFGRDGTDIIEIGSNEITGVLPMRETLPT